MPDTERKLRLPAADLKWGLRILQDFYPVLDKPAPLAGMAYPGAGVDWEGLHRAGYRHVICLAGALPAYRPEPVNLLLAVELEDLVHGRAPEDPRRETGLLRQAVARVLPALRAGEGVIVHCQGGTGRTGTVLGCLLREFDFPAREVLAYLDLLNRARGKDGWPESPWQAEFVLSYVPQGVLE